MNQLTNEQSKMMEEFTTDYIQNLICEFAEMAIEKFPEVAKNNPKEIGRIAKKAAFQFMNEALAS